MPEPGDFLCGNWVWDAVLKELRFYERAGKAWKEQPEAVERLQPVKSVTWYRWSQAPMVSGTGQAMGSRMSRVVAEYEGGGDLTINEAERDCAEKLADAIAAAFGLSVIHAGAPTGRHAGNLPSRDSMGRLVDRSGRTETVLDDTAGELTVTTKKRVIGKSRRVWRTSEIRRLELGYEVRGPLERYVLSALMGPEEERFTVASYEGYEGWAEPGEWREFAARLAERLGAELRVGDLPE
jgi:hypothetical protein